MGSWRGSSTNGEMLVLLDPNRNVLTCRSKQKGKDLYVRKFPTNEKDKKKEYCSTNWSHIQLMTTGCRCVA